MRGLKTWAWAVVIAGLSASSALAQTGGITSGGTTGGGTGTTSSSALAGGLNTGTAGTNATNGGMSGGTGASQTNITAPTIAAPTGSASSTLDASNFLGGYYGSPYTTPGVITGVPGSFGSALFNTTSSRTTTRTTTTGARGGTNTQNSNISGIIVPIPVQINYAATIQFSTPPIAPVALQTDLRAAISNTSMISNPNNVQILADANDNVVLRGAVKDGDEARLIEGMIRLTPGVRAIRNELTFPPGK